MVHIGEHAYPDLRAALDALPQNNRESVTLTLDDGVYPGPFVIDRPNIRIEGNGENTILDGDLAGYTILEDGIKRGTFRTASVMIDADHVTLENLTVRNRAGYGKTVGQAIAFMVAGDDFKAENCQIVSYQDTLFIAPLPDYEYEPGGFRGPLEHRPRRLCHAAFKNCLVSGSVDFIFGGGQGWFENCEIRSRNIQREINGYTTAPSTAPEQPYGFVFYRCRFTGEPGMENSVYLGRPWRDHGATLVIDCRIGSHIRREAWHDWNKPHAHETSRFKCADCIWDNEPEFVSWAKEVSEEDRDFVKAKALEYSDFNETRLK